MLCGENSEMEFGVGVRTSVQPYPLQAVGQAAIDLKHDAIRGAAVIRI